MKYLFIILIAFSFIGCDGEEPTRIVYAEFTVLKNPLGAIRFTTWFGGTEPGQILSWTDENHPVPIGLTHATSEESFKKGDRVMLQSQAKGYEPGVGGAFEVERKVYVDGVLTISDIIDGQKNTLFVTIP